MPKLPVFVPFRPDARDTRLKIIRVARRLMAQCGPESVALSTVARAAAINRSTVYKYFNSRETLLEAVLADAAEQASKVFQVEMPLNTRIDYMIGFFVRHPEIARLWMYKILAQISPSDQRGREQFLRAMRAFAGSELARTGIDAEMLGEILISAMLTWSVRVKGEQGLGVNERTATARFTRELKRLLLYGAVNPAKSSDMVFAFQSGPVRLVKSR